MTTGRPRTPTAAKLTAGTYRPDRDGDPCSIPSLPGSPVPPPGLPPAALAFWELIVPDLITARIVCADDAPALAGLCEWWARYRRFSADLDAVPSKGDPYRLMILAGTAWNHFDKLAARFGLTPSDRAKLRVQAPADTEPDPLEEFLGAARPRGKGRFFRD